MEDIKLINSVDAELAATELDAEYTRRIEVLQKDKVAKMSSGIPDDLRLNMKAAARSAQIAKRTQKSMEALLDVRQFAEDIGVVSDLNTENIMSAVEGE